MAQQNRDQICIQGTVTSNINKNKNKKNLDYDGSFNYLWLSITTLALPYGQHNSGFQFRISKYKNKIFRKREAFNRPKLVDALWVAVD